MNAAFGLKAEEIVAKYASLITVTLLNAPVYS